MDVVTWSLVLGSFALLLFYVVNRFTYWNRRGVPTAKGTIPFAGHALPMLMLTQNYSDICLSIYKQRKDISMIGWYDTMKPSLLIRDPNLVKTVLQTNFTSFHENGLNIDPELDPLLAKNPFFTYGDTWMTGRKRLTYAFSAMRLKILFETVKRVCGKFDDYLKKHVEKTGTCELELKDLFSRFTGEVVANAGLGLEGFCFEDPQRPASFHKIGTDMFEPSLKNGLMQALVFFFPKMGKLLRMSFVPKYVHDFFMKIVNETLRTRRNESISRNDFFQLMMELENQEGQTFDELTLAAHALSFFVDGYETSSATLSFVGHQLARYPDVQDKLREEVTTVIERHEGALTYEGLKEMTYMDQVISESQRTCPVVGFLNKVCTEAFELQGSDGLTCRVEPGVNVLISTHGLQTDPKYWTDPETFDPDRFNEERKKHINKYTFLPFGEGPRFCVGMRMAMLQMKACVATLLRYYRLSPSPKTRVPLKMSPKHFLSSPIGGLWVKIERL